MRLPSMVKLTGTAAFTLATLCVGPAFSQTTSPGAASPARTPTFFPPAAATAPSRARMDLTHLPLAFEPNRGQTVSRVDYLSHGQGYGLFLTPTEAVFSLARGKAPDVSTHASPALQTDVLRMQLVGASRRSAVQGEKQLPGKVRYYGYYNGKETGQGRTNIPTYGQVRYRNVYRGVDLLYYGRQGRLEYDFIVQPGTDPGRIGLRFEGARDLRVDSAGDLIVSLAGGKVRWQKPVAYQEVGGARRSVASRYVLRNGTQVGFQLAGYDTRRPLIIDPTLFYSTYLGGTGADVANGIAVYTDPNTGHHYAYVTGSSISPTFPVGLPNTGTPGGGASQNIFVAKLDTDATGAGSLLATVYMGGGGGDQGNGIAVSSSGTVAIVGTTIPYLDPMDGKYKDGLPSSAPMNGGITPNTMYPDAYVAVFSSGLAFQQGRFLGGSKGESGWGVTIDAGNNVYATGFTASYADSNPPVHVGFPGVSVGARTVLADTPYSDPNPYGDVFLARMNISTLGIAYATYLGGHGVDTGYGVAAYIDPNSGYHYAYLTGYTNAGDYPTTGGAYRTTINGTFCGLVAKINTDLTGASSLIYSTYLGGTHETQGRGIALDSSGNACVVGYTDGGFPTTAGARQTVFNGGFGTTYGHYDAFITKLNFAGSALLYSTYLGGSGNEQGFGIAVDTGGNIYITGYSDSLNFPMVGRFPFPTVNPIQANDAGLQDFFVSKLFPGGLGAADLLFSTYLGGSNNEVGNGIAVDSSGRMYVAGWSQSTNFPTVGAYQSTNQGGSDAVILRINP